MNFLNPLYALAALAIAAPILLHLVRKRPKDRLEFSSLLFLAESPQRLTRNSRIENWMLLLLRSLLVLMIAFAFARPYWSQAVNADAGAATGKRRCIVIDQSASMRRPGVWPEAMRLARGAIEASSPADSIAIYAFDDTMHPKLSISAARGLPVGQRASAAIAELETLTPSWSSSNLGLALVSCTDALMADSTESEDASQSPAEIVVISDLVQGCDLRALEGGDWPAHVSVQLVRAAPIKPGNASLSLLDPSNADPSSNPGHCIVRVNNARDAVSESFRLHWFDPAGRPTPAPPLANASEGSIAVTVPAGSNRIVKMPAAPENAVGIALEGDDCPYDNRIFHIQDPPAAWTICVIEPDGLPPEESLAYFLERLPLDSPTLEVHVERCEPGSTWFADPSRPPSWVVLSHSATLDDAEACRRVLESGSHVAIFWDRPANTHLNDGTVLASHLEKLTSRCTEVDIGRIGEARVRDYALMERLDFAHPILAPLANAKFNDFSRVRFWRHRMIDGADLASWRVLAWFGQETPAILERTVGQGTVLVMTSGWQPAESQLALSSKFVPLVYGMISQALPRLQRRRDWIVGASPSLEPGESVRSDDSSATEPAIASPRIASPGIYVIENASGHRQRVAANVDPRESSTDPLDETELSRFGVKLAADASAQRAATEHQRLLVATELEARQAWWWWLVSACLVAVGLESLLCWNRGGANVRSMVEG